MKLKRGISNRRSSFFLRYLAYARVIFSGLAAILVVGSVEGYSADLLSMPIIENQLPYSARDGRSDETVTTSVVFESQQNQLSNEVLLNGGEEQEYLLPSVNRVYLFLSKSLTDRMSLHLGLQGVSAESTQQTSLLFSTNDQSDQISPKDGFNFAGASLLLKLKLASWDKLAIYASPFVESGAGDNASFDLTRSVQPKGGWSLETELRPWHGLGAVLNGGARYRNKEEVGSLRIGDEIFYGGAITAYLPADAAVSLGADGRAVDVSKATDEDSEVKTLEDGRWFARIHNTSERLMLALQYSRRIAGTNGFGFGEQAITAQIGYAFGGAGRKASLVEEVQASPNAETKVESKAALKSRSLDDEQIVKEKYPEMIGAGIDPLDIVNDGSEAEKEFLEAEKKAKDIELSGKPTPSQIVEQELRVLQEAEAKVERKRAEEEKRQLEEERKNSKKRLEKAKKEWDSWVEEASEEASEIGEISPEELNWNGLE